MSDFEFVMSRLGPPRLSEPMAAEQIGALAGRVPATLLEFWRDHGLALYAGGLLHLCDPLRYDSLLEILFLGDPDLRPQDLAIYGFTPFGQLLVWHRHFCGLDVNLMNGDLSAPGYVSAERRASPDIELEAQIVGFIPRLRDAKDVEGKPLYARAVKKLGEPQLDETFGFFPALTLGGEARLENLRRVKALEHFAILAQTGPLTLKNFATMPAATIREIGG